MSRGPWFTAAFKTEVWRRWRDGENCADVARALGTYLAPCTGCSGTVVAWLSCDAGPLDRCRWPSAKRSCEAFAQVIPLERWYDG